MKTLAYLCLAMMFMSGLVRVGLVGPNRVAVQEEYGISDSAFGIGLAVIQIISAVSVLLASNRLRRLNPVKVVMAGLATQVAGFVTVGALGGLWPLMIGWMLVSTGIVACAVVNNIAMELSPANPQRGVVLLHGFNAVGKFIGPVVVAVTQVLAMPWRTSFTVAGAMVLGVLVAFVWLYGRFATIYSAPDAGTHRPFLALLRRPAYWAVVISFGLIAGGEAAFASLGPKYYQIELGLTPQLASLLLTVHLAGLVVGRFVSAAISGRVRNGTVIAVCLAAGVCVFPATLTGSPAVRIASLVGLGLMFSSTWPSFYAQVAPRLAHHKEMLAYGSSLGTAVGISVALAVSGIIADASLWWSLAFGPLLLWAFGLLYLLGRLGGRQPIDDDDEPAETVSPSHRPGVQKVGTGR